VTELANGRCRVEDVCTVSRLLFMALVLGPRRASLGVSGLPVPMGTLTREQFGLVGHIGLDSTLPSPHPNAGNPNACPLYVHFWCLMWGSTEAELYVVNISPPRGSQPGVW
jgi:hypothetical protein